MDEGVAVEPGRVVVHLNHGGYASPGPLHADPEPGPDGGAAIGSSREATPTPPPELVDLRPDTERHERPEGTRAAREVENSADGNRGHGDGRGNPNQDGRADLGVAFRDAVPRAGRRRLQHAKHAQLHPPGRVGPPDPYGDSEGGGRVARSHVEKVAVIKADASLSLARPGEAEVRSQVDLEAALTRDRKRKDSEKEQPSQDALSSNHRLFLPSDVNVPKKLPSSNQIQMELKNAGTTWDVHIPSSATSIPSSNSMLSIGLYVYLFVQKTQSALFPQASP